MSHDLLDDLFRAADEKRAGRPELRIELRAGDRPPAALLPHLADRAGIPREELVRGLLRRLRDVAEAVHADLQSVGQEPGTPRRLLVEIHERTEAPRLSTDDRDHEWQPEHARAGERLWRPADADPDRQRILQRPRVHALPGERWPVLSGPAHVLVLADLEEELELLGEERVVVVEVQAEQRKRFDERAASDHHLSTTT